MHATLQSCFSKKKKKALNPSQEHETVGSSHALQDLIFYWFSKYMILHYLYTTKWRVAGEQELDSLPNIYTTHLINACL